MKRPIERLSPHMTTEFCSVAGIIELKLLKLARPISLSTVLNTLLKEMHWITIVTTKIKTNEMTNTLQKILFGDIGECIWDDRKGDISPDNSKREFKYKY